MKGKNIIKGPILSIPSAPSSIVYSITLLSGHMITNPAGFGVDIDSLVSVEPIDSTRRLENYEPGADREQVHDALRRVATARKS